MKKPIIIISSIVLSFIIVFHLTDRPREVTDVDINDYIVVSVQEDYTIYRRIVDHYDPASFGDDVRFTLEDKYYYVSSYNNYMHLFEIDGKYYKVGDASRVITLDWDVLEEAGVK